MFSFLTQICNSMTQSLTFYQSGPQCGNSMELVELLFWTMAFLRLTQNLIFKERVGCKIWLNYIRNMPTISFFIRIFLLKARTSAVNQVKGAKYTPGWVSRPPLEASWKHKTYKSQHSLSLFFNFKDYLLFGFFLWSVFNKILQFQGWSIIKMS